MTDYEKQTISHVLGQCLERVEHEDTVESPNWQLASGDVAYRITWLIDWIRSESSKRAA